MNSAQFSSIDLQGLAAYRRNISEINRVKDPEARRLAHRQLAKVRRKIVLDYSETFLRRALGDDPDGTQTLVWFWFNHFNVFWQKGAVGAALPSYVEEIIRPNALGHFRDLLLGTMTHPAMLVYLDNARNVSGRINENYARELLELHTLGLDGGYSQSDVQETARLLTGYGLRPLRPIRWPPRLAADVRERGEFLFDPRRHDFGDKQVLGQRIEGKGYSELESLADLLVRHHATARHLAGKLCLFLVGEDAPQNLIDQAAAVFTESGGDIGKVVTNIRQGAARLAKERAATFKDPYRWLTSATLLVAAGRPVKGALLLLRWLSALGQPLFGCRTPDGYSLQGSDWVSAGQLTQRFELARDVVRALPRLLDGPLPVEQILAGQPVRELEARLSVHSREALARAAKNASERLALLLSSPEFMYW